MLDVVMLPITIAVFSATRFGLYISRHHLGSDHLLQQILLIALLLRAPTSWVATIFAGALAAAGTWQYNAAWVWLTYPAVMLRTVPTRASVAYNAAVLVWAPRLYWWNWQEYIGPRVGPTQTLATYWSKFVGEIWAFWDARYSQSVAWLWSFEGAQKLPHLVCGLIMAGIVCALFSRDGRTWILLAIVGLLIPLPGVTATGAASHREMFALVPLAVLAAWPLRYLPTRFAWPLSVGLAAIIAYQGTREWLDPLWWKAWNGKVGF